MSDGEQLTVSSTTDIPAVVEAVAIGEPEASRALVHESSLANFSESESADGQTTITAFENPSSERQALLERLAEAEKEIVELPEVAEEGQAADESTLPVDMEAIRRAATEDALADARAMHRQAYYQEQTQQHFSPQAEINRIVAKFNEGMEEIRKRNPEEFEQVRKNADNSGEPMPSPAVVEALVGLGATNVAYFLMQNPDEARKLRQMPDSVAVARVGQLQAQLSPTVRRQRSNAPLPITPVGGSSTRSSLPPDQMSYQDYSAWRERHKSKRR